jgi:two-component system sensor histidine kinase YesM
MISALVFVAILLKKVLVNPIQKLQSLMNQVEEGNFHVRTTFNRKDEIGKLGATFNSMVAQINNLIERVYQVELNQSRALLPQKQAELEALQERITPHFLYNTLNSISWFANQKGIREIQYVIDSLSSMLRYSVGNGSNLVLLKDEFTYIKLYADIIDFRYDGSITFSYLLPPSLEDVQIPRLSIQPIVENVVKYAFENTDKDKKIEIHAIQTSDAVLVILKDNGGGISADKMKHINESLNRSNQTFLKQISRTGELEKKGLIGLNNVHHRIKLSFGEEYGISLYSRMGEGTVVTVKLPSKMKKIS